MVFSEVCFFVKFLIVVGIYCREIENQQCGCIVKIFGVHDPRLRHNITKMSAGPITLEICYL